MNRWHPVSIKTVGFSLLELLLSLGIIALIILMATRYYSTARNAQLVSAGVLQIQGIRAGASNLIANNLTPSIDMLCRAGSLPSNYCAGASNSTYTLITPWSTTQTGDPKDVITPATTPTDLFVLTYYFPVGTACQATYNALNQDLDIPNSSCEATTGKGIFTFKQ